MPEFLAPSFSWPTWPATLLVAVVCLYWVMVIFGALAADALDFSFDLDGDLDGSILDFGFVVLRFLNLGRVPLMLWLSILALSYWVISRVMETQFGNPAFHPEFDLVSDGNATLRDFTLAVVVTKLLTNPLQGIFIPVRPINSSDLIGTTCVISTQSANRRAGEAHITRGGAPLIVSVRTVDEDELQRDDPAEIVQYIAENNVYLVRRIQEKE